MGAQQSSSRTESQLGTGASTKTCYYELLGVERQATDLEIKKAYRRKALELHPDRNLNDVHTATKNFADVQTAYEVLSDPQERAWFDSHRDAILSGQDGPDGHNEPTVFRNIRLTSAKDILSLIGKFNADVPFDDEPTGFFGITRETFEHLALEEEAAADIQGVNCPTYPTFGSSDDDYETTVRVFYNSWAGFSTQKSFSWRDKYRLSDAPDRRVRRLMEKENKGLRDEAIREFNDAVRFLLSFVRKRDPRYLPNMQTAADRQRSLRSASAAQAARSRAENQAKLSSFEVPEWARRRDEDLGQDLYSEGEDATQDEESEAEILECVVCNKTFRSGQQLEAHERSKKHTKAIQRLRYQMRKEGIDLDLDGEVSTPAQAKASRDNQQDSIPNSQEGAATEGQGYHEIGMTGEAGSTQHVTDGENPLQCKLSNSEDSHTEASKLRTIGVSQAPEEATTVPTAEGSTTSRDDATTGLLGSLEDASLGDDPVQVKKVGKAKAKRQKKAAAMKASKSEHRCCVCMAAFSSRTKLFNHINAENHATPVPKTDSGGAKTKVKG